MTSHVPLFSIIFQSKSSLPRKYFGRIVIAIVALVPCIMLFSRVNDIPTRYIDIDVETHGPEKTRLTLTACVGSNTQLNKSIDSTYWSPFAASGRTGVVSKVIFEDGVKNAKKWHSYAEIGKVFPELSKEFPDDAELDSLNAAMHIRWRIQRHVQKITAYRETGSIHRVRKDKEYHYTYDVKTHDNYAKGYINGDAWYFVKAPVQHYRPFIDIIKNHSDKVLYNDNLWTLADISQSYVAVHLSGSQILYSEDMRGYGSTPWNTRNLKDNPVTLDIDFGSPISVSNMIPEPDAVSMTCVEFSDPKKIEEIVRDGLVFHVKFLQNENLQSMKLFWLTTIIAALVTWIATTLFKWIRYSRNRRRIKRHMKDKLTNTSPQ